MEPGRRRWPVAAAAALTGAYACWVATLRPFTWPALVAVGLAGVVVIAVGTGLRTENGAAGRVDPRGVVVWAVLCVALAGWELSAYLQHPRSAHPTLSSLADQALDGRPARAVAFLLWVAVGADLVRR